jgi:carboxymethylenebutenolidase
MSDLLSSTFTVGTDKYTSDQYASRSGVATRPVVVILHGVDGMVEESEKEIRKLAAEIAGDGYLVFVPHYLDPAPGSTAMPSRDVLVQRTIQATTYRPRVTAAVDYALAQPGVDTTRVGIVGLSLGGGLALWYAESAPRGKVKAVVDYFGHIGDQAIYVNAGKLPPTLIFHNYDDGIVNRTMSEKLIAALVHEGVVHDSEIYREPPYPERWEHTFRPGGKADVDSRARTRKWLDMHIKP